MSPLNLQKNKIKSIEGLRFIAAIGVMLSHFCGAFYPSFSSGPLWNTPMKLFMSGTPFVRIFFTLSGFVVAMKYISGKKYDRLPWDAVNRYIRLLPMVFLAEIFAYILMKSGLMFNIAAAQISGSIDFLATFNNFPPNLLQCLHEIFIGTFRDGSALYVGPFWTIQLEFLGVLLVLAIIGIFRDNPLRYIVYAAMLLLTSTDYNYFIIGMIVAELYCSERMHDFFNQHQTITTALLIIVFLVFSIQNINDADKLWRIFYGVLIAALILLLINSHMAEKLLGCRFGCFGGKISYGIYAFHWAVIESYTSFLYMKVENRTFLFMLFLFISSLVITIGLAFAATVVSEKLLKLVNKLNSR